MSASKTKRWTDRQIQCMALHAAWSWFDSLVDAYSRRGPEAEEFAARRDAIAGLLKRRFRTEPDEVRLANAAGPGVPLHEILVRGPQEFVPAKMKSS